ncbi:LOW QUALITY PROTEIN: zinc carboxypeptidase-like [Bolinopsis microptera]|uniref:LOW QUALITY PROTEIN: zinc carboxypeptidase-like n=1 Tax=Bolinopsis microptera TaxID=2820187 RepID=UPI0030791915
MLRNFVILVALFSTIYCYKTYDGYKILRVNINSADDHQNILSLESEDVQEIFSEGRSGHSDVLISFQNFPRCQTYFQSHELTYSLVSEDVGAEIRKERQGLLLAPQIAQGEFSYDTYHRLNIIYEHLDALAVTHSSNAETFNLPGETFEGRKIQAIRITTNVTSEASKDKPLIWLDGGIHAREWVSPATVMYIIDSLLGEHEKDKSTQMTALLDEFQFIIAPSINPDGYEHSHVKDRLWRKTRKPSGCKKNKYNWFGGCFYKRCYGVDPNRNWSTDWGRAGVSTDPCSEVYPGKEAFDQENTRIVSDFLTPHKDKLKLYVTYHSYSQLFLTPLGYTTAEPANYQHHLKVGACGDAIAQRHGAKYINQRSAALYPASGDSADWAHDVLGLTDSYTFELRPDENSWKVGFELPEEQILPTGEENVDGLLALIANIEYNNDV